jgi:hypothetical protein
MNEWMNGWMILLTYFSVTQESTCIVPWMDEQMNKWMNDLDTHTSVWHKSTCIVPWMDEWMNKWMNEWDEWFYTHTSSWHKNQHV